MAQHSSFLFFLWAPGKTRCCSSQQTTDTIKRKGFDLPAPWQVTRKQTTSQSSSIERKIKKSFSFHLVVKTGSKNNVNQSNLGSFPLLKKKLTESCHPSLFPLTVKWPERLSLVSGRVSMDDFLDTHRIRHYLYISRGKLSAFSLWLSHDPAHKRGGKKKVLISYGC